MGHWHPQHSFKDTVISTVYYNLKFSLYLKKKEVGYLIAISLKILFNLTELSQGEGIKHGLQKNLPKQQKFTIGLLFFKLLK